MIFILLAVSAAADVYAVKTGDERFAYYTRDASDATLYFKSGVKGATCRTIGLLEVRLAPDTDPDALIREFGLERHESYPGGLYFFKTAPENVMPVAALIWERTGVLSAVPVCARKKRLQ